METCFRRNGKSYNDKYLIEIKYQFNRKTVALIAWPEDIRLKRKGVGAKLIPKYFILF